MCDHSSQHKGIPWGLGLDSSTVLPARLPSSWEICPDATSQPHIRDEIISALDTLAGRYPALPYKEALVQSPGEAGKSQHTIVEVQDALLLPNSNCVCAWRRMDLASTFCMASHLAYRAPNWHVMDLKTGYMPT